MSLERLIGLKNTGDWARKMRKITDVTKKRETKAIILVDESLLAENEETYRRFIELYNSFTRGNNVYKVDWKHDFHVANLKNAKQLMDTVSDIAEKIKPSQVLFLSQTIYDDILRYYDNATPYFELMARASNRMIVISKLLIEMRALNSQNA